MRARSAVNWELGRVVGRRGSREVGRVLLLIHISVPFLLVSKSLHTGSAVDAVVYI